MAKFLPLLPVILTGCGSGDQPIDPLAFWAIILTVGVVAYVITRRLLGGDE